MRFSKKSLTISLGLILIGIPGYLFVIKKALHPPHESSELARPGEASAGSSTDSARLLDQTTEAVSLPVKVAAAQRGDLIIRLKFPGEAYSEKKVVLKAEISGTVKSFHIFEGKEVREGELLVEIDDREYQLRLESKEAQRLRHLSEIYMEKRFESPATESVPVLPEKLDRARADLDKATELLSKGLISREEFEKAKRGHELSLIEAGEKKEEVMAAVKGLTQAEVEVKIARLELEKTRILAPFSGIITDIKISPQEQVSAGHELFTLVDIHKIKVKAHVLESEAGKIKIGHKVNLVFSAYPDKIFKGQVEAVSPIIDTEDKTCPVHIRADNPAAEVKPGMHAEVEIAAEVYPGRLLVPQEAVLVRGGRKLVFVVEGDLAKWRYIESGLENEESVEVLEGVREGELVIIEGHFTLAHDARVTMRN
jgi:RND family efflux transporter MFP subunit